MRKILLIMSGTFALGGCVVDPGYQASQPSSRPQQPAYGHGDAIDPATGYHASGNIPCSMGKGHLTGSCPFGVKREGSGNGMVTVTKPDGRTRTIFFSNGRASGYDQSQADSKTFRATRQSDLNIIYIGDERYEIPDAVIWGG